MGLGLFAGLAVLTAIHQLGKYHEALGSRAYVIGWVAGDERQLRIGGLLEHAHVVRLNNALAGDYEGKDAAIAPDLYLVAFGQFVDVAKESITMRGDYRVARFAGHGSLLHVPRTGGELFARHPFNQNCVHIDFGNDYACEHLIRRDAGMSWRVRTGCLALPFNFKVLLAPIHSPIRTANIAKQANANDDQGQRCKPADGVRPQAVRRFLFFPGDQIENAHASLDA